MELQYCDNCHSLQRFQLKDRDVDDLGYNIISCPACHSKLASCMSCPTTTKIKNWDHRSIKNHMRKHDNDLEDDVPALLFRSEDRDSDEEDGDSDEEDGDSDEEDELDDDSSDQQNQYYSGPSDGSSSCSEYMENTNFMVNEEDHYSFSSSTLNIEGLCLPDYGNFISNTYFQQEYDMLLNNNELFGGIRGICWRSRYRLHLSHTRDVISLSDTEFMFDVTKLLSVNTETVNELQYKVMNGIAERTPGQFDSANPHVRIPKTKAEADRYCLTGQFGIFNNLPCPTVHTVGDHACMKLKDIIAHHLSLGRRIEFTDSPSSTHSSGRDRLNKGIHGCQSMDELLDDMRLNPNTENKEIYYAWMLTWSDSFLRSYVKQKYNNVWMYTITLPDPSGNATSPVHTYCVAVGAGALDHTSVIDWYASEVDSLMKGSDYYCAFMKKVIHVRIGVVAALADRPEKAYTLKTALLGLYGRMASWATDIVPDLFADCKNCFSKRLHLLLNDPYSKTNLPTCKDCCQWELNSESKSRKKVPLPTLYPTKCCPDSPEAPYGRDISIKYLIPVPQSFPWLICAVEYASHNVKVGVWNKGVMVDYLRSCAVATSVRENLWVKCKPPGAKERAKNNQVDDGEMNVINDGEINDGYDPLMADGDEDQVVPKIWSSSLKMHSYIDCAMHLIFHGILAYCVERIEDFMKTHCVTPDFEKLVNVHMTDIQSHRLEWCKLKTFPKKQWIAENEIGLARILPFIYGLFFRNVQLPERCNTSNESQAAIMQLLQALFVLISMLMSTRNVIGQVVEEHVKFFLSTCHRFCRSYFQKNSTPFWANTGNFPTLLCLGDQINRFGPVRLYWEGTRERYIQELKKHLVGMRRNPEYFSGKLCLMYRTNVMNWIREKMSSSNDNRTDTEFGRKARMYYQYRTLTAIQDRFTCGEVISGFALEGDTHKIMVAYGKKRRSGFMNIVSIDRVDVGESMKSIGLAYVTCLLEDPLPDFQSVDVNSVEDIISHHCILLPFIQNGTFTGLFAVVYDDWDVGDECFKKCLPMLCSILFSISVL